MRPSTLLDRFPATASGGAAARRRVLGLLAAVGIAVTAVACGDDTAPGSAPTLPPVDSVPTTAPPTTEPGPIDEERARQHAELDAARERWRATGIDTYELRYDFVCFCPELPTTVRVLGGRMIDDAPRDDEPAPEPLDVEGWFDDIDGAIDTAFAVRVEYDPALGFPTSLYVDIEETIADEEYGIGNVDVEPVADPIERWFTERWGCGYGAYAGTPGQTAAIVTVSDFAGPGTPPEPGTAPILFDRVPIGSWTDAELRFGADLFANWCDDVIEPGEPEPVVAETWAITGGEVTLTVAGSTATAEFSDLVATTPSGAIVELGSPTLINDAWGVFAG